MRNTTAGLFLLFTACASPVLHTAARTEGVGPAAALDTTGSRVVPAVDHHQHLLGPATAEFWNAAPEPTISVAPDVIELLAARERAFGDSAALAALYTDEAQLLHDAGSPTSARGQGRVAATLARLFGRPYTIRPTGYSAAGNVGYLTGHLQRPAGETTRTFGQITLTLARDGARWRIASEALAFGSSTVYEPLTAEHLVGLLDEAGIRKGLVLSVAYTYGGGSRERTAGEYDRVRAENDWVANEAARYPDRLRAFCSFNPLSDYALQELERCHSHPQLHGIKLHFGNSRVDLRNADHLARVREVFSAANERRMPVVVHVRTSGSAGIPYGPELSRLFIEQVLPVAPDIPIQIAHLAGSGPGYTDPPLDSALAVFAEARSAGDSRTQNLWFDVTTIVNLTITAEDAQRVATRIRQLGVERVLYGSDMAVGGNLPPRQGWALVRSLLPLTESEIRTIASNVAPYMR